MTVHNTRYDVAVIERSMGDPATDVIVRTCDPHVADAVCQQFQDNLDVEFIGRITYHVETFESMGPG